MNDSDLWFWTILITVFGASLFAIVVIWLELML